MEYVQERITTLHDFTDTVPDAPTDRASVVIPMTGHAHTSHATDRILRTLEDVAPARVVIALRADAPAVASIHDWLAGYDVSTETIWCNGPRVNELLTEAGFSDTGGKGRDVWLALGVASDTEYTVVHDADVETYSHGHVNRLLFPLERDYSFVKGYYARIERNRLYGRLFRLFYAPLIRALSQLSGAPIVSYLDAFRYALAGEMAMTARLARRLRVPPGWGLEVGALGTAFEHAGFEGTAQIDLGVHKHDHRSVDGPHGLGDMSVDVGASLFSVLEADGVTFDYESLREQYQEAADRLIDQYATDAAFNGLDYDSESERDQIDAYLPAVTSPTADARLPAWTDTPIDSAAVRTASQDDIADLVDAGASMSAHRYSNGDVDADRIDLDTDR
ncbi:glycosyl transferase family 2 [Halocatena salina]|uniref:Glycosyl transferase family 2 n=1 Tax=Halocatena salina TaxID=2934340 RepID=A0A8U0A047_9EURY|nr:glycosyl transferase family 2 [Halocatena salina]UPM42435.1 glycosyl transferase family 2 [Halocatena salina]